MGRLLLSLYLFDSVLWIKFQMRATITPTCLLRHFCLAATLAVGTFEYCLNYVTASHSVHASMLVAGPLLANAAVIFTERSRSQDVLQKQVSMMIVSLMLLLLLASIWQVNLTKPVRYHDNVRLSGPWDNPNLYGLLMGAGIVLTIGQMAQCIKCNGTRNEKGTFSIQNT